MRGAAVRRFAAWWFAPVPAERLAMMRILVGTFAAVYLAAQGITLWKLPTLPVRSFAPVGVLRYVLEEPIGAGLWRAMVIATGALAVAFTVGVAHRVLAPVFAVLLLLVLSYRNSWGMVFHTENLLALHVIVLALVPAADAWSVGARGTPAADGRYGWPLRAMAAVTCAAYVLAGIAKLRIGGLDWISGEELRDQVAIDNLRKVLLGSTPSGLATPLLEHPGFFTAFAALTVVIELGAPVALVGGRVAGLWALGAWSFHVGVVLLMKIVFPYPLVGLAFAPLFAVERPAQALLRWLQRRRGSG